MITRVLDESGDVVHDCNEVGCDVSWDGFAIRDLEVDDLFPDAARRPPNAGRVVKGDKVPNAQAPDLNAWIVRGNVAQLKRQGG